MSKSTIYIIALSLGALLGLLSLLFKKGIAGSATTPLPEAEEALNNNEIEMRKAFALHHFKELQKTNPHISLDDDFPEDVFPKVLLDLIKPVLSLEEYTSLRITVVGNDIFINNDPSLRNRTIDFQPVLKLEKEVPVLHVFEDGGIIKTFVIEPKTENPNLKDQYLHCSIRVNANSSVQIDGCISKSAASFETNDEMVRFQPFYLSDQEVINQSLKGKGLFQRGLHYRGFISNGNIRLICLCDVCAQSFSVDFYHAGFSEVQYFYSTNSKETLLVPYDNKAGLKVPIQNQTDIDPEALSELEQKLPSSNDGTFAYYNNFKCPHCYADYINFKDNKDQRPGEYYVNFYLNQKPITI